MTDSEIVKALECCDGSFDRCEECPLDNVSQDKLRCWELEKSALDLINRLQKDNERLNNAIDEQEIEISQLYKRLDKAKAEIEELKQENEILFREVKMEVDNREKTKAEAYKEFAERLKDSYTNDKRYDRPNAHTLLIKLFANIDNLLKEMVGEDNV